MIVDGEKLPYVEVSAEFARNPSEFVLRTHPLHKGSRINQKQLESVEIEIPVILSRRNPNNANEITGSWDSIIKELTDILYVDNAINISFSHGDDNFYVAHVTSIKILEEKEFSAKGSIFIFSESPFRYSEEKSVIVEGQRVAEIKGQTSVDWRTRTVFTSNVSGFEFEFNSPGKTELRDINVVKVNGPFKSGDILEINYSKRSILLNGNDVSNQIVILDSNYKRLPIGNVEFSVSHKTEVYYHEQYY